MLCELAIRNFAIIDDVRISFSNGLTILSGETGAGKSIIINAVNLILGSRATAGLIRTGCEEAELEAFFHVASGTKTQKIMQENGFEADDGLLIRRILSRRNRHKIYINGRLATIQMLSAITENLAGISGQHAHQRLLKEELHLRILDQFAGLLPMREKLYDGYHRMLSLVKELHQLNQSAKNRHQEVELLRFQQKEIADAALKKGEDEQLELTRNRLKNAQWLLQTIHDSLYSLYDGQGSVIELLTMVKKNIEKAAKIDPNLTAKNKGIEETLYIIEDITGDLRGYLENIGSDPDELDRVEVRLDMLTKLKRKYSGSIEGILDFYDSIERELNAAENFSDKIETIEKELNSLKETLFSLADELSDRRKKAAEILGKKVENELSELNMPNSKFCVAIGSIHPSQRPSPYLEKNGQAITEAGIDTAKFMINPNVGEELKPLTNIASGGELSRVVLALNAISAKTDAVGTIVFDEVDAGIGGATAEVVGKKLAELARYHQVLCITHLPQIAKFANHHYRISKEVDKGRTITMITPIDQNERVREIARMMGGESITQKTLDHAKEMLEQ